MKKLESLFEERSVRGTSFRMLVAFLTVLVVATLPRDAGATVSNTSTQTVTANGDGSGQSFTIGFPFLTNSSIEVYLEDTTTSPHGRTQMVGGSGAGQFSITGGDPGTKVHTVTPPTTSQRLVIQRNTAKTQPVAYDENSAFPAADHEEQMDRVIYIEQELARDTSKKIGLSAGSSFATPIFPDPTANYYIKYDSNSALTGVAASTLATDIIGTTFSGVALSAVALVTNPTDCNGNSFASSIDIYGNLTCAQVGLTDVAGLLPVAKGGTNSSTALVNNFLMGSTGGKVAELGISYVGTTMNGNLNGTALSAISLNATPTACNGNSFASSIDAYGNLTCAQVGLTNVGGILTVAKGGTNSGAALAGSFLMNSTATGKITESVLSLVGSTIAGNLNGTALSAISFSATPTQCTASNFATGIDKYGNLTCSTPSGAGNVSGPASTVDLDTVGFSGTTGTSIRVMNRQSAADTLNYSFGTAINGLSGISISIYDKSGASFTSASPGFVAFNGSPASAGAVVGMSYAQFTGSTDIAISGGVTLGCKSAQPCRVYVYSILSGTQPELAVSLSSKWDEGLTYSTLSVSSGPTLTKAGLTGLYSNTARTGVYTRYMGFLDTKNSTAGSWAALPYNVSTNPQAKRGARSEVDFNTWSAWGSVNTKIPVFTTATSFPNTVSGAATTAGLSFSNSSSSGGQVQIQEPGLYCANATFRPAAATEVYFGITLNASGSTAVTAIAAANVLCLGYDFNVTAQGGPESCSWCGYLDNTDIVQLQTDVQTTPAAAGNVHFHVVKMSDN